MNPTVKQLIAVAITLVILAVTVVTYGDVNSTFDGLLSFVHGAYQTLLSVLALLFVFITALLLYVSKDESDEADLKKFTNNIQSMVKPRPLVTTISMVVVALSMVGTYVYLEWSGFLYWYLTTWVTIRVTDLLVRSRLKELGITLDEEDSEDSDDLSEFQ